MTAREIKRRIPRKAALATAMVSLMLAAGIVSAINPNTFELDGNATDETLVTGDDWGTLFPTDNSANELSRSFVDDHASIDDTYFTGGSSKDDIDIDTTATDGGWLRDRTSSAQPKADIIDAFAAAYSDPSFSPAHKVIYFGADRFSNDGATFMGFWFLKEGITYGLAGNNGVGEINGHHTVGDILVLTDFTQGGPVVNFAIFQWVASGGDFGTHLLRVFQGTDCKISLATNACSTVNSGEETSPWPFVPKSNVGPADKFQPGLFIEGAIDLTALFPTSDGCFSSFVAETRASFSVTSTLSDFTYGEFNTCGEIDALKYHDKNANGSRDADGVDNILGNADDEGPLSGWTIFLDKDADEILDAGELSGVTDASGQVVFADLTTGSYSVCEQISDQSNWINSDPTGTTRCETVNVGSNGAVVSVDFGNYQNVNVKLVKYHDLNANGTRDAGEPGLENWQFYQENGANEVRDAATDGALVSTNASGEVTVSVTPGAAYKFCEVLQASWINSDPSGTTICESTATIVSGTSQADLVYGNYQNVAVSGLKWHDRNADGVRDADGVNNVLGDADDEVLLAGWSIHLFGTDGSGAAVHVHTSTDATGDYSFTVTPGSYTICETQQTGWAQTYPIAATSGSADCSAHGGAGGRGWSITAVSGTPITGKNFGNRELYRLIVLTCSEATGLLVQSTIDLDGAGETYAPTTTIGTPPVLSGKTIAELQAYLCNLGGAQYNNLAPQTFSSIQAIVPKAS